MVPRGVVENSAQGVFELEGSPSKPGGLVDFDGVAEDIPATLVEQCPGRREVPSSWPMPAAALTRRGSRTDQIVIIGNVQPPHRVV